MWFMQKVVVQSANIILNSSKYLFRKLTSLSSESSKPCATDAADYFHIAMGLGVSLKGIPVRSGLFINFLKQICKNGQHEPLQHKTFLSAFEIRRSLQAYPTSFSIRRYSSSHGTTASVDKNYQIKDKKSKTLEPVKVMLISETDNVSVMTLDEAQKLAHRRGLELTKLDNKDSKIKTEKPVYKLSKLIDRDQIAESGRDNETTTSSGKPNIPKDVKTLIIHDKIGEHDLMAKVKNVSKWIPKGHRVSVFIKSNSGTSAGESIFQTIEKNVKEFARIVGKQKKGNEIRFQIAALESPAPAAAANKVPKSSAIQAKEKEAAG